MFHPCWSVPEYPQLKVGGKMVIPVGPRDGDQELILVERENSGTGRDSFRALQLMGVRYVPLVRSYGGLGL